METYFVIGIVLWSIGGAVFLGLVNRIYDLNRPLWWHYFLGGPLAWCCWLFDKLPLLAQQQVRGVERNVGYWPDQSIRECRCDHLDDGLCRHPERLHVWKDRKSVGCLEVGEWPIACNKKVNTRVPFDSWLMFR